MKVEIGVMVIKDGKGWGSVKDGNATRDGWMSPDNAPIHNPEYCKKTTDVVCKDSYMIDELKAAELVHVKRTTITEVTK
jgi:hypothetical protein